MILCSKIFLHLTFLFLITEHLLYHPFCPVVHFEFLFTLFIIFFFFTFCYFIQLCYLWSMLSSLFLIATHDMFLECYSFEMFLNNNQNAIPFCCRYKGYRYKTMDDTMVIKDIGVRRIFCD